MDGATIFWTAVGILFVCWVLKCIYMRHYGATGRHHTYWFSEIYPRGAVWFNRHKGVWMTQPRFDWAVPRRFDERSNPLDIEPAVEIVTVPLQQRRIEREVEY